MHTIVRCKYRITKNHFFFFIFIALSLPPITLFMHYALFVSLKNIWSM